MCTRCNCHNRHAQVVWGIIGFTGETVPASDSEEENGFDACLEGVNREREEFVLRSIASQKDITPQV